MARPTAPAGSDPHALTAQVEALQASANAQNALLTISHIPNGDARIENAGEGAVSHLWGTDRDGQSLCRPHHPEAAAAFLPLQRTRMA